MQTGNLMSKKLKYYLSLSIILIVTYLNAENDLFKIKTLHGDIDLSALYSMWDPTLQSETQEINFINSKTLSETSLNIKGHLEYVGHSIFKIDYVVPLKNTSEMKNIIDYNSRKEKGIENLKFYFIIDPIMSKILSGNNLKYFRFFTNLKYHYQRKRYITNAFNNSEFFYIPENATYNSITENIVDGEYIQSGTNMTWNSEIIEQEITLKILEITYKKVARFLKIKVTGPFDINSVPVQLRIGYFTRNQKQPTAGIFSYDSKPTIMDAYFITDGIVFQLVTINEEEPGFNMDCKFKGYSNWLKGTSLKSAAFDLYKDKFNSDAYPAFMSLGFDFWYNIRFSSKCLLTFGSKMDLDAFFIYIPNESNESDDDEDSMEMMWRLRQWPTDFYIRFGYRF